MKLFRMQNGLRLVSDVAGETIRLEIVTPTRKVYSGDVNMVIFPTVGGQVGVLPGHIPYATTLVPGVIKIRKGDSVLKVALSNGFLHVRPDRISVLAETAETQDEIDVKRAEDAKRRALERLSMFRQDNIDYARAESALKRALARLEAAEDDR
jgi:F-type H+-transporting ATPase subunit epsilon